MTILTEQKAADCQTALFLAFDDSTDEINDNLLNDPAFWARWGVRLDKVIEPEIDEAAPERPRPSRRKRKPNITTLIKRARDAGERGPVRVELVNDDGTRTIVTSLREAAPETITEADAEKLWHERISKNAAH
jgi:hypothetical protein